MAVAVRHKLKAVSKKWFAMIISNCKFFAGTRWEFALPQA